MKQMIEVNIESIRAGKAYNYQNDGLVESFIHVDVTASCKMERNDLSWHLFKNETTSQHWAEMDELDNVLRMSIEAAVAGLFASLAANGELSREAHAARLVT